MFSLNFMLLSGICCTLFDVLHLQYWFEQTELYYGFYTSETFEVVEDSFYNMKYAYLFTCGGYYIMCLIILALRYVYNSSIISDFTNINLKHYCHLQHTKPAFLMTSFSSIGWKRWVKLEMLCFNRPWNFVNTMFVKFANRLKTWSHICKIPICRIFILLSASPNLTRRTI